MRLYQGAPYYNHLQIFLGITESRPTHSCQHLEGSQAQHFCVEVYHQTHTLYTVMINVFWSVKDMVHI